MDAQEARMALAARFLGAEIPADARALADFFLRHVADAGFWLGRPGDIPPWMERDGSWVYTGDEPFDHRVHFEDEYPESGEPTTELYRLAAIPEGTDKGDTK